MLDKLGEDSVDIEAVLDELPSGAPQHANDRYNALRRTRDIHVEEAQFATIEALLYRYQEERVRLADVLSDGEGDSNDAVDVGSGLSPPDFDQPFGLMSHTQTHYPFLDASHPEGFSTLAPPQDPGPDDLGLGLGHSNIADQLHPELLAGAHGSEESLPQIVGSKEPATTSEPPVVPKPAARVPLEVSFATIVTSSGTTPSSTQSKTSPPRTLESMPGDSRHPPLPRSQSHEPVSPPRKEAARRLPSTSAFVPPRSSHGMATKGGPSATVTTTVTTSATATMPISSVAEALSFASLDSSHRRRSSSEGQGEPTSRTRHDDQDQLFRVRQIVTTRSKTFSQNLDAILARARDAPEGSPKWMEDELRSCQKDLDRIEDLESSTWSLVARLEGKTVQTRRIDRWREWLFRQTERMRTIKSLSWDATQREADKPREDHPRSCQRSSGHVEKVKLPTFSGRQEEFSEFKSQFRELCKGERYTPILEMAQLRLKLPREALAALAGLQCLEEAWLRLEEVYGNRELSILTALKNLREFKPTKPAAHEQVIEIAMATQKCLTILKNIGATADFLGDRESLACVVQALPPSVRDKWYDLEVPTETAAKGEFLVKWLEGQRQKAIRVRLDTMASKLRESNTSGGRPPTRSSGVH